MRRTEALFSFTNRQARQIRRIVAAGSVLGAGLGLLAAQPEAPAWRGPLYGALVGFLIPILVIAAREIIWNSRLVRLPFALFTTVNVALNFAVILIAFQIAAVPFPGLGWVIEPRSLLTASLITVGFTGWYTIDRFLGAGTLTALLTGRYHHPRYEDRIFLLADLADSTRLAQELGDLRYHSLLNAVFSEIGPTIDRYEGAVHRYVGDEMIITWITSVGIEDASCLTCAMGILDVVGEIGDSINTEFGVTPRLRIALHAGQVVAGELTGQKRQIVFSGDTINTAARIEEVAGQADRNLVISSDLLDLLDLPEGVGTEPLGTFQLKGRREASELFAVTRG